MSTHRCPVAGCAAQVPRHKLMCLAHWRMVPKAQASELYDAYAEEPSSPRHVLAMTACTTAVDAKLAR